MPRLRFAFSLFLEHLWSYLGGVVLLAATLWMGLAIPRYLQEAIDILRVDPELNAPQFLEYIYWILGFAIATAITRTGSRLLFFIPGRKVEYDLKNRLLAHLLRQQRDYFLANPTGALISRVNNDINGVRMMMGIGIMMVFSGVGTLTLAPYYMYQISPTLTVYCAVPILAAFALLQISVRVLRREQMKQMKAMQGLSDFTVESYNGLDVLKSYRGLDWAIGRFGSYSGEVRDAAIRMSTVRAYLMPLLTHIVNAVKVLLVFVGGLMMVRAEMTMGGFAAYLLYLTMLISPLMGMTFLIFIIQRGMTSLVSMLDVLHTEPELPAVRPEEVAKLGAAVSHGVAVKGLNFSYPDEPDRAVLRDITFEVRSGEVVGLFGTVGSGKSTLVNLLNRYLTPSPGAITIDGVDVRDIPMSLLREHVVTVTQDAFMFSDTIHNNVVFSRDDVTQGQVDRVIDKAAFTVDVERMPAGQSTQVGEKGITLSGGQKQRLSLARALLQPCDLLILDDVLSA
ncbi:MAG: ABC transporter ATP-binding protein/permease, partial [Gammaproteobacteria bacterium]|nr:ABC transporter ATP-binding protein/permease [Gammaproteobacteria bacterium]